MPSPIAHSLAGFAVFHFALRRQTEPRREQRPLAIGSSIPERSFWIAALVFAANAADLDFLAGFLVGDPNRFHHGPTHTLIAPFVFGLLAAALAGIAGFVPWRRFGIWMGLSYFTHLLLDCVTLGTREPYGMRLFWPFSSRPLMTPFHLFMDIRHDGGAHTFLQSLIQWHNAEAVLQEIIVMTLMWTVYRALLKPWFSGTASERKMPQ